jgi:hypothetical protein
LDEETIRKYIRDQEKLEKQQMELDGAFRVIVPTPPYGRLSEATRSAGGASLNNALFLVNILFNRFT